MIKKTLLFISFLWSFSLLAKVEASLDLEEAVVGDHLRLSLIIEGSPDSISAFPTLENIQLLGTNRGYSSSSINGITNTHTTIVYTFTASKPGKYNLKPFVVMVDGKKLESNSVSFEIRKPSSSISSGKKRKRDDGTEEEASPSDFVERSLAKSKVYVGESLLITTKFWHSSEINNVSKGLFQSNDFRTIEFDVQQKRQYKGDKIYGTVIFKRAMVPLKSGSFKIGSDRIQAEFVVPRKKRQRSEDDVFSHFFGRSRYQIVPRTLATQEDTLEVLPIPMKGRPKDYQSLVGDFRVRTELSSRDLKVGETSTLTITIAGHGLLDGAQEPKLDLPSSVKVYADKPSLEERKDAAKGLYSQKVFKFALVPTKEGEIKLGTYHESYFDPKTESFKTLKKDLGTLKVAPGEAIIPPAGSKPQAMPVSKKSVEKTADDLMDIKRDKYELSHQRGSTFASLLYFLASLLLLAYALLELGRRVNWLQPQLTPAKKRKVAFGHYQKGRKDLESLLESRNLDKVSQKYGALLRGYLGYKFDLNPESLTTTDIQRALDQQGFSSDLKEEILKVMKILDRVSFGYSSSDRSSHEQNIKTIDQLVKKVESHV